MAEALAAIGTAASIIQLVEFGAKLLDRLNEFHSRLDEVPTSFQHIKSQLPLLLELLKGTQQDIDAGVIKIETERALQPAIEGCKTQIKSLDSILDKELPSPHDSRKTKTKKAVSSVFKDAKVEKITSTLGTYIRTLTFYHAAVRSTLNPLKGDEKLVKIRQWLSAPDPSPNYHKALKLRQAGTGLWFRNSDQFTEWTTSPSSLIWLYGIPGCGKTILSSTIIKTVEQQCENDLGKVAAYFYFDFTDPQKQQSELMIKSLVTQLSHQCIKIPTALDTLFSSCGRGQSQPSAEALLNVLQQMCGAFPATYIVLDALDECDDRDELMTTIKTLFEWRLDGLHLLVTSRQERDIEVPLKCLVHESSIIPLQNDIVDEDIQRYVRHRLTVDTKLEKWQKDAEIRTEIEVALKNGAHGMFRWAVCQLDTLGKCVNRARLRRAIKELPSTLDKTYERILCAIDEEHSTYALRILQWLAFSARPLLLEEIAEVVAIDPRCHPVLDRDEILEDPLDALRICSSLVVVSTINDEESRVASKSQRPREILVLVHYSVKEYLTSERILRSSARAYTLQEIDSNTTIANCCIGYLLQFQSADSFYEDTITTHKLAQYSAEFWISHTRSSNKVVTQKLIMDLFSHQDGPYLNWIRIYDLDTPWKRADASKQAATVASPLYYASLMGLTETVCWLVCEVGADLNAQGGRYGNALQAASIRGLEVVVRLLLDRGADVNAQGGYYSNALQAASDRGHEAVVKLLLDRGADVNAQGGYYSYTLQAASDSGHKAVVKLLLDRGADVNAQGGYYSNALQAASNRGHEAVVKLLLDSGADVNAQGGYYGNALQAASDRGHEAVVKLLLDRGADVNADTQGGLYGSALQAASSGGWEGVVKLLLDRGADVNAQGGYYGNALQAVSIEGHEGVVKLLLDRGADVNADTQGRSYGSALQAASYGGHEAVVRLLLDRGADVNIQGGYYGNALHAASSGGREGVVKLLLARGARRQT
ncbi:MAG: hypothetical protein M1822_001781 [Bathelium mastoideum]|nr:MAG: hypothetical protein M1822_001781 [Bathelium mastoideum]